ncbi:MAG: AAA family ATPase [Chthoniobacter sp.]|nr:AAA family ATPase [Chthoniobacter sp.]
MEQLAAEIIQRWPERFATTTMQRLGIGSDRVYSAEEVKEARESIAAQAESPMFLLRGEIHESIDIRSFLPDERPWAERDEEMAAKVREARTLPNSYPASSFTEYCLKEAHHALPKFFVESLCLDPEVRMDEPPLWYFPGLVESLAELHDLHAQTAAYAPVTEIGAKITETLEYALAERGLVVIDGLARTGKTFAVKAWCDQNPGQARYVQVPPSNDDMSLFRALAEALGIGTSHAYKALELRGRIETVLQTGDLLLVLDEGWALWPQRNLRKSMPGRINWVLMQLVNMGVPVAIVTTPQFTKSQEDLVKNTGWSAEQLIGRILHYERLPDLLGEDDLKAVARHWLPGADADAVETLTTYAQSSEKYLQGIESLARRSRFLAKKASRSEPTFQDVVSALKESVVPSDNALASALHSARPKARNRPAVEAVQGVGKDKGQRISRAGTIQHIGQTAFRAPARDAGETVLST